MKAAEVETSYAWCTEVARSQAKNFYYSFLLLDSARRRAMCAMYAFMRYCDDLSDSDQIGDRAAAIARQAQLLDFDVTIVEDRPEFASPERFGGATVIVGDIPATVGSLEYGWNSFLVIATRGHKLDADCVVAAARTPVRYVGLLGSRRKTVLMADRLREEGIPEERVRAIHAPVGLDLGGRTPAEIALSVLAEITAERYQASGRPLGDGAEATSRSARRR